MDDARAVRMAAELLGTTIGDWTIHTPRSAAKR
jgi:hypothetical protein